MVSNSVKAVQVTHSFDVDGMGMEFTNKKYSFTQISPAGEAEIVAMVNTDGTADYGTCKIWIKKDLELALGIK